MPRTNTRPDPSAFLDRSNANSDRIDEKWAASNDQWWDWYLSLAHDDGRDPGPEVASQPLPALPPPSMSELEAELDSTYPLPPEAIEFFRREGFVKLKQVCSPASLLLLRRTLDALFAQELGDAPAMRFPSLEMMRRFGSPVPRQRTLETAWLWPDALALRCPPLPDRFRERGHGLGPAAADAASDGPPCLCEMHRKLAAGRRSALQQVR
jgi:hypothetical protein